MTSSWYFISALLLAMVLVTHAIEASIKFIRNTAGSAVTLSNTEELGNDAGSQRRLVGFKKRLNTILLSGRPCYIMIQPQYDKPELEGLSPVRLEMGPGDQKKKTSQRKRHFPGLECLGKKRVSLKHEKIIINTDHHFGHREFERHRHSALYGREPELAEKEWKGQSLIKPTFSPMDPKTISGTFIPSLASVTREEYSSKPPFSKSQEGGDSFKNVVPIHGMVLFDHTGYGSLKRAETQQHLKKKGRLSTESLRSKKKMMTSKEIMSCNHHLDCMPGSCCNLRKHVCDPYNRGLNNKCYDDCMCEEGLHCFTKFHLHYRVVQKKGRCVDPEYTNTSQGAFNFV
ncbi:draxin-B [Hoplias malabaricus]|uniref:draxin-B n=1 Tax=Hoplias malabaricus TaxID=27720 RepID=UPI003463520B